MSTITASSRINSRTIAVTGVAAAVVFAITHSASAQLCTPAETAEYELRFDATWTAETHPQDYPPNPHFSPLVGGSHSDAVVFWEVGGIATQGIESMAETGSTSALRTEVNAAIDNGTAREFIRGSGVGAPPASTSLEFTVSQDHPLATIVTMIAPSPDWFVGVNSLSLIDNDGQWIDQIVVDLYPYDAGTDSGITYTSPNEDTDPQEPIAEITGYPFLNNDEVLPLGTFTFTRINGPCLKLCVDQLVHCEPSLFTIENGMPGSQVAVLWALQPGQYTQQTSNWCVDFDIKITGNPLGRVVTSGPFDANGEFAGARLIPCSALGLDLYFQAAQRGTCPDTCMSNVLEATVQ